MHEDNKYILKLFLPGETDFDQIFHLEDFNFDFIVSLNRFLYLVFQNYSHVIHERILSSCFAKIVFGELYFIPNYKSIWQFFRCVEFSEIY